MKCQKCPWTHMSALLSLFSSLSIFSPRGAWGGVGRRGSRTARAAAARAAEDGEEESRVVVANCGGGRRGRGEAARDGTGREEHTLEPVDVRPRRSSSHALDLEVASFLGILSETIKWIAPPVMVDTRSALAASACIMSRKNITVPCCYRLIERGGNSRADMWAQGHF